MNDDFLTFKYEQADRKHRTGQKLTEDEWEALLAGERAKAEQLRDESEDLEAKIKERDAEVDRLEDTISALDRDISDLESENADLRANVDSLEDALERARAADA